MGFCAVAYLVADLAGEKTRTVLSQNGVFKLEQSLQNILGLPKTVFQ